MSPHKIKKLIKKATILIYMHISNKIYMAAVKEIANLKEAFVSKEKSTMWGIDISRKM